MESGTSAIGQPSRTLMSITRVLLLQCSFIQNSSAVGIRGDVDVVTYGGNNERDGFSPRAS